jgi:anthranilate synthase/aminodeoxychorismate synthase-like glutamine amidotransferase
MSKPRVVILDNYDSFAYNLYQRIGEITGTRANVVRNDRVTVEQVLALEPTHIIISPGPGNPEDPTYFGVCRDVLLSVGGRVAVLGVCLGHQGIGATFGGRVIRAPEPMHGKARWITHDNEGIFRGIPNPMLAMRYHSLVVDPAQVPSCLRITARTEDGLIMGLVHRDRPIQGVQFHPESIGTPHGVELLRNFILT